MPRHVGLHKSGSRCNNRRLKQYTWVLYQKWLDASKLGESVH